VSLPPSPPAPLFSTSAPPRGCWGKLGGMARWKKVEAVVTAPQERALGHLKDGWVAAADIWFLRPDILRALERKELAERQHTAAGSGEVLWRATPKGARVWARLAGQLVDKPSRWTTHLRPEKRLPIHTPKQRQEVISMLSPAQQTVLRRLGPAWLLQGDLKGIWRTTLRVLERRRMIECDQVEMPCKGAIKHTTRWRLTDIGMVLAEELPQESV